MHRGRFSTRLILSLLLVLTGFSCATLLIVGRSVRSHVRSEINAELESSVVNFQNAQRRRELEMLRTARLLANLPSLKALMTTQDSRTVQDGSDDLWRLGGSDLLVLGDRANRLVALHVQTSGERPQRFTRETAQPLFAAAVASGRNNVWWFGDGHLYEVFVQPVFFGPESERDELGFLALGYEIDERMALDVVGLAGGQVVFRYGSQGVASTLSAGQTIPPGLRTDANGQAELALGNEEFLVRTVLLDPNGDTPVTLSILKSFDKATGFLVHLYRLLLILGTIAVLAGSGLLFFVAHSVTQPLARLIAGVRALQRGDYDFPLNVSGSLKVAEVIGAFGNMRSSLRQTQSKLLAAEQMAMIGRMAASISHDLRHQLSAILANAEFLLKGRFSPEQREELFEEVRCAVNDMTELLESMLELSRQQARFQPESCSMKEVLERTIKVIGMHPDGKNVAISFQPGPSSRLVWAEAKRLQRALSNVVLNACQAAAKGPDGRVEIGVKEIPSGSRIEIMDNGPGIGEEVRGRIFDAFFSAGKENGTGLGLTIAHKIIQDHGGALSLEHSSPGKTLFVIEIPAPISDVTPPEKEQVGARQPEAETRAPRT